MTRQHKPRVEQYIQRAIEEGPELVLDGRGFRLPGHESSSFLGSTLLDHVKSDMKSYQDEIFGPVLQIERAETFEEAVQYPYAPPNPRLAADELIGDRLQVRGLERDHDIEAVVAIKAGGGHLGSVTRASDSAAHIRSGKQPVERKRAVRILNDLPREIRVIDVPDSNRTCACCGQAMHEFGEDCSEHLGHVPARIKFIETC